MIDLMQQYVIAKPCEGYFNHDSWLARQGRGGSLCHCKLHSAAAAPGADPADHRSKARSQHSAFDQATLTEWWGKRGRPLFPHLLQLTDFASDLAALRKANWDYCLIDTPPTDVDLIETAILEADATLIPVRPSDLDISACRTVVEICRRRRKPFAFILCQVDTRPAFRKINDAAIELLGEMGTVLSAVFPMNKAYLAAVADPTHLSTSKERGPTSRRSAIADSPSASVPTSIVRAIASRGSSTRSSIAAALRQRTKRL